MGKIARELTLSISPQGGWGWARRIEFTKLGRWGIVKIRENEENAPRFQRSGKKVAGVCVFAGGDAALGAGLGRRVAGCWRGLLRWGDVSTAWAWAEEKFE